MEPMDAARSPEAPQSRPRSAHGRWGRLLAHVSPATPPGCAAPARRRCWGVGAAALGLLLGAAALLTETMRRDASVQIRRSTAYISAPRTPPRMVPTASQGKSSACPSGIRASIRSSSATPPPAPTGTNGHANGGSGGAPSMPPRHERTQQWPRTAALYRSGPRS
jgi:hypothetical protein